MVGETCRGVDVVVVVVDRLVIFERRRRYVIFIIVGHWAILAVEVGRREAVDEEQARFGAHGLGDTDAARCRGVEIETAVLVARLHLVEIFAGQEVEIGVDRLFVLHGAVGTLDLNLGNDERVARDNIEVVDASLYGVGLLDM